MKPVINAWTRKGEIQLLHADGITTHTAEYVAYFRRSEWRPSTDHRIIGVKFEGDYVRVSYKAGYWDHADERWIEHREQACRDLPTVLEGDVHPIRRLVADTDIEIARPRRCYLDIETDSRVRIIDAIEGKARVLCWVLVGPGGEVSTGLLSSDDDAAERELLFGLWQALDRYDQVVAWNGDHFDFPVIRLRSKLLNVCPDTRRWLWLDHMLAFKRYNIMSAESGEEKQSFALNSIANQLLGYGKHDLNAAQTYKSWKEDPSRLLAYCVQDTKLLPEIEGKTGYLELFQTVCEVCKIFPDSRSLKPTRQMDGFMLRLGREHGIHFPTVWYGDSPNETESVQGAFVMEPTCRGITKDVHVCDFSSLYPSIMISWNLSPDVKLPRDSDGCLSPKTGVKTSRTRTGLVTFALKALLELRKVWKKRRGDFAPGTPEAKDAEYRTNAYKQVANSMFGCMLNIHSRFYDREIGESITLNGQWLLEKTMEEAKSRGISCIYGDTDSLFCIGCTREEFADFVAWCNSDLFPAEMSKLGCPDNIVKLGYEKQFAWIILPSAKRYCGKYAFYEGTAAAADSEPEIKGLEYKRGDAIRLCREMQKRIIDDLCAGHHDAEHYLPMIQSSMEHILSDPLALEDVCLSKSLSKEPEEYAVDMAHVKMAELLRERGEDVVVGDRIGFVVTDASVSPMRVIPAVDFSGACDRHYLWERRVYPASMNLLQAAFPDYTRWKKWAKTRPKSPKRGGPGDGQMGLF